jgi:hypothetical protein
MATWVQLLITALTAVLASSGFWAFIMKRTEKNDAEARMLVGLGHDRIIELGLKYIQRGWITEEEYENLNDYLYKPYEELGGNGSAKKIMMEVNKLPIRQIRFVEED